jgi:type I restriction enzyme S subunit
VSLPNRVCRLRGRHGPADGDQPGLRELGLFEAACTTVPAVPAYVRRTSPDNLIAPDEDLARVRVDGTLSGNDLLREGDILTVRSNGNKALIGRCMMVVGIETRTTYSGFTIRIRPNFDLVDPEYLCRYLRSPEARARLVASGAGANISSLSQKALDTLPIPLATIRDQRLVVARLAEIDDLAANIEIGILGKLVALRELKQSLLLRAFSGELARAPLAA